MGEDKYRYASKRSTGNEPCIIELLPGCDTKPAGTFKAYPDWNKYIYKLYPADRTTYCHYKKHIVSMDLVREYK